MTDKERLEKYILLFGLRKGFSLEELSASYRMLAKLNHPDVSRDKDSIQLMTTINEGYDLLKQALSTGAIGEFFREQKKEEEKDRVQDIFYNQYKKGFVTLKNAFEDYYGESEDKSYMGNTEALRKELLRAKIEFSVLINDLPYNQWVNDAIDKINSINKWLD
jgi:DnaJ-class molecular chaperone